MTDPTTAPAPAPTTTAPPTTLPPVKPAPDSARVIVSPHGVILPVQSHDAAGWHVETPCGNSVVVANGTPVGPVQVVLDPGHGGPESGAVAPNNGLTEAGLNMAVAPDTEGAPGKAGRTVMSDRS